MIKADVLLKNAILLTLNQNFDKFEPGALAIKKNIILDAGDEKEILSQYEHSHPYANGYP